MTIHFDPVIRKKQAITYIDDTIKQSQNKNEMFTVINEYYTLFYATESLVSDQHAEKQNFSRDKSSHFGIQQESAISTIW